MPVPQVGSWNRFVFPKKDKDIDKVTFHRRVKKGFSKTHVFISYSIGCQFAPAGRGSRPGAFGAGSPYRPPLREHSVLTLVLMDIYVILDS